MKMPRILLILLFWGALAHAAHAGVFQYFDEEGTLIVTDDPFGIKKRDRQKHHRTQSRDTTVRLNFRDDVAYEYYEVSGRTVHDAMAATDRLGPFDSRERRHYAGQTRWNFGLSYTMDFSYRIEGEQIVASVQISDIDFRSDVTVILPMLADNNQFSPHDVRAWEDFVQQLAAHEHDHVRIIREPRFRQEAVSRISGIRELTLPIQPNEDPDAMVKNAIELKVGSVAHDSMRMIKQKNDEYDQLTDHGRKPALGNVFFQGL